MVEILSRLGGGQLADVLTLTVLVGLGLVMGVVITVATLIAQYHERQLATSLILEMLDRGMSAEDIVRVLSAAGLKGRQEKLASLRQRLRQRLSTLGSEPAKPTPDE